jgi:type IV pilus assembly protein PilF
MYKWMVLSLVLLSGCAGTSMTTEQAQNSARIHTELAGIYFERAQMGVALGEIDDALAAKSNYAPAYNVRALIHMALHEDNEAESDFKRSLSIDSDNSDTHSNYGWFLCQRGKEKESIPHFISALKNPLYQTPEQAYLNAAVCSQKIGNNNVAEDYFQRALVVRPDLPQALLGMAQLNFGKEEYGEAKKFFLRYAGKSETLSAADLWLAVRISRELSDRNSVASYSMKLRNTYPDSKEARLLNSN